MCNDIQGTLGMLALRKCKPCSALKGVGGQDGSGLQYFLKKILNKFEKVDFLQIRYFFIAEMGKDSSKSWIKQGT